MNHRISIVTTNFNGATYLEKAMQSVLEQAYPDLEYIVIDGGSTDGSQRIIERYERQLTYWESEPDRGFAHAYNKGFARATGDVLAYLNSDDMYCPWAFEIVNRIFVDLPEVQWLTSLFPICHSTQLGFTNVVPAQPFSPELFRAGLYGTELQGIQQESTFWRRSLWEKAGGYMNENLKLAIDADLWARFFNHAELYGVTAAIGGFRVRPDSKSGSNFADYLEEMRATLLDSTDTSLPRATPQSIRAQRRGSRYKLAGRIVSKLGGKSFISNTPFYGKTVHWDYSRNRFIARNSPVLFE